MRPVRHTSRATQRSVALRRPLLIPVAAAAALVAAVPALPAVAAPATPASPTSTDAVTGGPGAMSHFGLSRKDCLGTAANRTSKVWYTVANGVLSDVYSPTIDNTNVETLQLAVTDGSTFTDLQSRDATYTVRTTDKAGMACEVTSRAKSGKWTLVTEYVTDPARDAVVMKVHLLTRTPGLQVYVRYDASVNGNGGGGDATTQNGGADDASVDGATTALVSRDLSTASQAANRDYATPLYGVLRADRPFTQAQSGFVGTASDGLTQLDADHRLTSTATTATAGNVVQTARLDLGGSGTATLALGYAPKRNAAIAVAGASATAPFASTRSAYEDTWTAYDAPLRKPPRTLPGLTPAASERAAQAYWLSVNVLKASEDKTFPGAVAASLSSPWGQAVAAGTKVNGQPVYFGSYREIFARDLYEAFTGFLAAGDVATAQASTRFLFERQQLADGRMPRNSLPNGQVAPDTGGDQLDETSYPILMALQSGLAGDATLYRDHIKKAADFVVAHGPSFGNERWEEQSGYSPSTIAAEIAGLVAAGRIADVQGDHAAARVYRATADHYQRSIKGWTVTSTGPYATGRYFIRLSKNGNPDEAVTYNLGNGSVDADQRSIIDQGFLELPRLGVLPAGDPDVRASLKVVDQVIRRDTPTGTGFYRYGTDAAGSEDGYGDCWTADPTDCPVDGQPWPTTGKGSGHLWPVLGGERAEHLLATGNAPAASSLLRTMDRQASGVGLVPEQTWEDPAVAASPYGTDPTLASIGFEPGKPAGSAAPLTWAQAQEVRLVQSLAQGRLVEQPKDVAARYAVGSVPTVPVTVTAPATADSATTGITGTAPANARVDVAATATDSGGTTTLVTVRAGADGTWSATIPTPTGTTVVTATVTTGGATGATGFAQATVVSSYVSGTVVQQVTDPTGDDDGPGTYAYPTASAFHPGAYDLTGWRVVDSGDTVVLQTTLADLTPTFGSALGAQLLDVYVHTPDGAPTSTSAAFPSRNYSIAPADAWSQRIEVQGFAPPVWVDATGASKGTATVVASQPARTITISLPKASLGGTPGPGWSFAVVLAGQDGFSSDQARAFTPTPGDYSFGVCQPGGTSPICALDPSTVPKAMDVLTPPGVDQASELDPTAPPVEIAGVPVG
ncbi:glucan 1,4-alpha-glucosidase [Lapillicoccus jejuensis]|uniref:Glucan 1,4-alpha-glucosidase n=1 Tax=Lapillicoccus jejuensis TaxID=402171 RepID=A0A542E6M7_9MICO|nr:glucan 1,4-alpha-glucosidase [Lapillicoccus jejuensis]